MPRHGGIKSRFEPIESLPVFRTPEHFDPDDSLSQVLNAEDTPCGSDHAAALFPAGSGSFRYGIKRVATRFVASASFDDFDGMDGCSEFLVPQVRKPLRQLLRELGQCFRKFHHDRECERSRSTDGLRKARISKSVLLANPVTPGRGTDGQPHATSPHTFQYRVIIMCHAEVLPLFDARTVGREVVEEVAKVSCVSAKAISNFV